MRHDDSFFSAVEYILLDPSCSGSGIVSRMDNYVDGDVDEKVRCSLAVSLYSAISF